MINESTILVVEDTLASLKLIADILAAEGYQVRPADSGELALASVEASQPELILLDIQMPGMNGFEVLRRLKAREDTCDIPVIILSALTEVEQRVGGLNLGAVDFISKPFQPEELLARVRIHMELFRMRVQFKHQTADLLRANKQLHIDITERKQVETSLRESEAKYRILFEGINDAVFVHDLDEEGLPGRFLQVNDVACRRLGYTRKELMSLTPRDITIPEEYERIADKRIGLASQGDILVETVHVTKDGLKIPVESNIRQFQYLGRQVALSISRDITERKRAEEALQQSESALKKAQKIGNMGHFSYDPVSSLVEGSDELFRIFDVDSHQSPFKAFREAVHPEDGHLIFPFIDRAVNEGIPYDVEHRVRHKNGTVLYVHAKGETIGTPQGKRMVGIVHDITTRKQAEEALQRSESLYRLVVENINDIIWTFDLASMTYTFVSPSAERILGYADETMVKNLDVIFTPETKRHVLKLFGKFMEGNAEGNILVVDAEHRKKDGSLIWMEISASPLKDDLGNIVGFLGATRNITERKRAAEEKRSMAERLQRAEKMEALGQLAGGVAHDLNNVLGVLSGYSELLLLGIPEGSQSRGHVEKILQSTHKGAAIIEDLLTLARRGVTASDVIDLNSVVSGFLQTPVFEKMKDYHPHVTFRTEYDKDLLNIKGSPVHLEKTLMNLVSNAAEAVSGKGEVTIRTESRYLDKPLRGYDEITDGDYTVLTVSDTGMGIPAENIGKIFEPFYTKKTMGRSGTGLGLAIVWGTIKDHNGYIDVQSIEGRGTTFTLYFPVTREEMIEPQQKELIEQYMGNGESVLVVDDIAEQREIASRLITSLGYEVYLAASGEDAVEYLRSNKADILVLDMIMMPGIDGLETYQRILEINPQQKAIIVSGFSETDRAKEAEKIGAGAYVKKPYLKEKIGVAIRDELNRK